MHAYLIIGGNTDSLESKISELIGSLNAERFDLELQKISDVRNLESNTKLAKSNAIAYVIKNIDTSTIESLNAFLKTLEEPNINTYFILTAKGKSRILPTILSRCQIISLKNESENVTSYFGDLLISGNIDDLFSHISTIKDREEGLIILSEAISALHNKLLGSDDRSKLSLILNALMDTRIALEKSGNIKIQFTNLVLTVLAR